MLGLIFCSLFSLQCKKEMTTTSSSAKLAFSTNLVFFDTVFVSQGSSVRIFVVHNYNNEAIVTSIKLAGNFTSSFEINVDGVPGVNFNNVKIPANDSIYIFTQVNINPLNGNSPALVQDSLIFTTNGNTQWVDLHAYGWNAYYYYPNNFLKNGAYSAINSSDNVWKNDKPHVVFGDLFDTAGCPLTIEAGTLVYFHNNGELIIDSGATLTVSGTSSHPVIFQGDRLEPAYANLPQQWNGLLLYKSTNCRISWAVIQNATTGIQVDTLSGHLRYALVMDHTIIKVMAGYGLLAEGTNISANNCLIADCQSGCLALFYGNYYEFYQCTFADYWGVDNSYGQRSSALLSMNNGYYSAAGQNIFRALDSAYFYNCIVYGALNEELALDSSHGPMFNYYFENCVVKTQTNITGAHGSGNITQDPLFVDPGGENYTLNAGSPASAPGAANTTIASKYPIDLAGNSFSGTPSIGAYWK